MAENPEATAQASESASVTVTNTYRNQPLLFHVAGGSIRLGPCETQEMSRDVLSSPELAHLVLTGVVQVRDRPPADASADAEAAPQPSERPDSGQ
jgi:hypothetical protein